MSWAAWNKSLAAMSAIESNARWIAIHAARMESAVNVLPQIPPPAIGPDDELAKAERQLTVTLAQIRAARKRYRQDDRKAA
jgi:hypothetical protein